jgi:hypothetical protein
MIEIQRQQAAATVYEQFLPATATVSTLNAPSTRGPSCITIARGHRVKDASAFTTFASSSATAAMWNPKNAKPTAQIRNENCLGLQTTGPGAGRVNQIPEIGDKILLSTLISSNDPNYRKEDIVAAARQALGPNCCITCGKWQEGKVTFASGCTSCSGINPGAMNADGTQKWKNAYVFPRTVT